MKKIISLIMCIALVLTMLSGCSVFTKKGLIRIEEQIGVEGYDFYSLDIKDNLVVILTEKLEYEELEAPEDGEENYYDDPDVIKAIYGLTTYDLETKSIVNQTQFEKDDAMHVSKVRFTDDEQIVIKTYLDEAYYYDYNLKDIKTEKYKEREDREDYLDDSSFGEDLYCITNGVYEAYHFNFHSLIFKDDPDILHIIGDADDNQSTICACSDKSVLSFKCGFTENREDLISATFSVNDYGEKELINSATLDYTDLGIVNVRSEAAINDKYAFIIVTTDKLVGEDAYEFENSCYYWDYTAGSNPTAIECEALSCDDLAEKANEKKEEIAEKNNIFIDYNVEPADIPYYDMDLTEEDKYYIDFKLDNPLVVYDNMLEIEKILNNFPDGMVSRLDNFELFLVNSIEGCGAYANNTVSDPFEENIYFVVLGLNGVSDLPHELMHCFEAYIMNNYEDNAFANEYDKLNIYDFFSEIYQVGHEDDDLSEYVYNEETPDKSCFVTEYATTNRLEDKAETFQMLYRIGTEPEKFDYDAGKLNAPVIRKKAELICKTLREYFPEIKEETVWEKALSE